MKWYLHVLTNYTYFSGRAHREEYWKTWVIDLVITCILVGPALVSDEMWGFWIVAVFYRLAVFLPMLAVLIRRLHDTERHWLFVFVLWIPWVGWLIMLVFLCQKGTAGYNSYGPDPLQLSGWE